MKKLLHFIEKLVGVYRWHPKIALRYLPVTKKINSLFSDSVSILEVGSANLGIAPYIRQSVVGLDLKFEKPLFEQLIAVYGSVLSIPFVDNSFGVVVSLDMLEHIAPANREKAIYEMLRVTTKLLCLGVPVGEVAHLQDEELRADYQKKRGASFHFLDEQVEYGVPMKQEIMSYVEKAANDLGKSVKISCEGNINLTLRKWLMTGWISNNIIANLFFRKILLLFIPIMLTKNQEPTYRQLFFVTIG